MGQNVAYLKAGRTAESDECYTPIYAVEPLLEFIKKDQVIWCPFDEEWSAYVQVFKNNGNKVINTHLDGGYDFFNYEPSEHYDVIISNPPFSKKDEVLNRLYSLNKPFCILLPTNSLQGKKRGSMFYKHGLELLNFDSRIDFHMSGNFKETSRGVQFGSSYFCKDFLPDKLMFRILKKYDKPLK